VIEANQAAWLASELAAAPSGVPLIVALYHPPYSVDAFHGGSATMGQALDTACASAARVPELVLSGHVHDYQRFTRAMAGSATKVT
jgi:3',5'-cyclic AMP phosphodiesterase CpdA